MASASTHRARRFQAAVELIATHDAALRRTARRHSICIDDAEDAYQRALEILLTKGPECEPPGLIAWMHTVTKHEAMGVRRARERLLGTRGRPGRDGVEPDTLDSLPSDRIEPPERAERSERVTRSIEVLGTLKPQERRALLLKAEGYSYAEIQRRCGWTYTKVNRCMAEGRKAFLERFADAYGTTREQLGLSTGVVPQPDLDRDEREYDHRERPARPGDEVDDDQREDQRGQGK